MGTQITNKKLFLKMLGEQLDEQDIILLTTDVVGELSVKKKLNQKKISFAFAADAFKDAGDIGHFAFGKTPAVAFSICRKEDVSDETLELLNLEISKQK